MGYKFCSLPPHQEIRDGGKLYAVEILCQFLCLFPTLPVQKQDPGSIQRGVLLDQILFPGKIRIHSHSHRRLHFGMCRKDSGKIQIQFSAPEKPQIGDNRCVRVRKYCPGIQSQQEMDHCGVSRENHCPQPICRNSTLLRNPVQQRMERFHRCHTQILRMALHGCTFFSSVYYVPYFHTVRKSLKGKRRF